MQPPTCRLNIMCGHLRKVRLYSPKKLIGPLHEPVTWYKTAHILVSKLHSGTSKTMLLVPVHLDLLLFWKGPRCTTCLPACLILYHVTGSCKGPITSYKTSHQSCWGCGLSWIHFIRSGANSTCVSGGSLGKPILRYKMAKFYNTVHTLETKLPTDVTHWPLQDWVKALGTGTNNVASLHQPI